MRVKTCRVIFNDLDAYPRQNEKLRGYLGNKYMNQDILHNHDDKKFHYRYPLVQYKILNSKSTIIGIEEGAKVISKIALEEDEVLIGVENVEILDTTLIQNTASFGTTDYMLVYRFITPWLALSQKNIVIFNRLDNDGKRELLEKILIGNIISMSKGLKYTVDKKLICDINLETVPVKFKGLRQLALIGEFAVNFAIPDYLGIGKGVSKGYGTVQCLNNL